MADPNDPHNYYRQLMRETAQAAPGRFSPRRLMGRLMPLSRSREDVSYLRNAVEVLQYLNRPADAVERVRRQQVMIEGRMVRHGDVDLNATSIPVRAGVEAIRERVRAREAIDAARDRRARPTEPSDRGVRDRRELNRTRIRIWPREGALQPLKREWQRRVNGKTVTVHRRDFYR
jgi:hypothetical protein